MSIRFDYDGATVTEYYTQGGAAISAYPFTFACWFNTDDATVDQVFASIYQTTGLNARWDIGIGFGGTQAALRFFTKFNNSNQGGTETSTTASSNVWHHACAVGASSTDRRIYLDNAGEGSHTTDLTPGSLNTTAICRHPFMLGFAGMLAEWALWNVALGADDRAALAAGYSPLLVRRNALVRYRPMVRPGLVDVVGPAWSLTGTVAADVHPRIIYPERSRSIFIPAAAGGTVSPGVVSHSYSAQAPKASASVAPGEAAHTYTALAPKVSASVAPGDVTHIYTAQAPQLRASVMPAQVTHAYSAETPVVTVGASVQPGAVVHTYSGIAPKASTSVAPGEAAHSYSAAAPNVSAGNSIAPPEATHIYTGQAPKVSAAVAPDEVTHSYAGETPQARTSIDPGVTTHDYAAESPAVHLRVEAPFVTHVYTAELADASGIIGQPTPGRTHYARAIQRLHEARARIHYARARPREK